MGNRRLVLDEKEIIRLYLEDKKSASEIARLMSCSVMAIFRRLDKYDVKHTSQSDIMSGRKLSDEHRRKISDNLPDQTGENNPNWKGGRSYTKSRNAIYPIIRIHGRYVKEHRYVMEQYLGRTLKRAEHIHHLDGDKFNNKIENLQIMSVSEHAKLHNADPEVRKYKAEMSRKARANRYWSTKKK